MREKDTGEMVFGFGYDCSLWTISPLKTVHWIDLRQNNFNNLVEFRRTLGVRRRPEGLGVEGPLPLPLVNPDARGFELGKEYHQIQKMRSNAKYMLLYKR